MTNFQTILFPVDFSDRCKSAAPHVRMMASKTGAKILLLNVFELPKVANPSDLDFSALAPPAYGGDPRAAAQRSLDRFLDKELDGLPVERHVESGDPALTIVSFAREQGVDLIMMPTHGYGGFRRFILGSVTAKVLHDAECAVWTGAHLEDPPSSGDSFQSILCAIDIAQLKTQHFAAASELAKQHGAKLAIASAVPGTDALPGRFLDRELRQTLISEAKDNIASMLTAAGVTAGICVEAGEADKVVNTCAKSHQADLIVIGRPTHEGFGRLRMHSYAIIRESPCPVLSL